MRFRKNCERLGEIFAYEISKTLDYSKNEIKTPLGISEVNLITEQPVLATILRAGLPFHQGFLNYFDNADNAFISAFRNHHNDGSFDIEAKYIASPSTENRTVIISDPMLASGASMETCYKSLLKRGKPSNLHIAVLIASKEAINYIEQHLPENSTVWVGAIDNELTNQSYIIPGMGDAGDLAFGIKE